MKKVSLNLISILVLASCNLTEDKVSVQKAPNEITTEQLTGTWNWIATDVDTKDYNTCESFTTLDATTHLALSFEITVDVVSFSDECSDVTLSEGIYDLKYNDPSYDEGSIVIFDDESKVSMIFRVIDFNLEETPPEVEFKLTFIQDDEALLGATYSLEKLMD